MGKQFIAFALLIAASSIAIASVVPIIPTGDGLLKGGIPEEFGRKHSPSRLQRRSFEERIAKNQLKKEEEAKKAEEEMREKLERQIMEQLGLPAPETRTSVPPGHNGFEQAQQASPYGEPSVPYGGNGYEQEFQAHPYYAEPSAPPYQPQASPQTYGMVGQPHGRVQHGGMDSNDKRSLIKEKLEYIIGVNRLGAFYNEQRVQNIVDKLVKINFVKKAKEWDISEELIYDLVAMALYDVVFFCDDSGSMTQFKWDGRIDELRMILKKVSDIAMLFDEDGVDVRFMNSDIEGKNIKSARDVDQLIPSNFRFSGVTPLGGQFNAKVLQPLVVGPASRGSLAKPVLAICITDGAPTDICFQSVIVDTKNALENSAYGSGAVAIEICQVGLDKGAQKYLATIDNDPLVGNMVDATSSYELEEREMKEKKGLQLTVEMWWMKLSVGAIDPNYDAADE